MVVRQVGVTTDAFEQFLLLPENQGRSFELIYGEITEKMPTQLHALIVAILTTALMNFLHGNPLGWVLVEARYELPSDQENARVPDLSFVKREGHTLSREGAAPYMPDLAVEVQSPGQSDKFMVDKAAYYLANGSRMVWLIYPEKQIVEVLTPTDRQLLTLDAVLSGGDVLPGFTLPLSEIFAE
jgi:Uma2 family endonuclease